MRDGIRNTKKSVGKTGVTCLLLKSRPVFIIFILFILFCNRINIWKNEFLTGAAPLDVTLLSANAGPGTLTLTWNDPAVIRSTDFINVSCALSSAPSTAVASGTAAAGEEAITIADSDISDSVELTVTISVAYTGGGVSSPGIQFRITPTVTGTKGHFIYTAEELNAVRGGVPGYTDWTLDDSYYLMADLDLSAYNTGEGWVPIGDSAITSFTGRFFGNGYTISNLIINRADNNQGLFGHITSPGYVSNLGVLNVNINVISNVGGVVGYFWGGNITGCYTTGTINANDTIGGLAGQNNGVLDGCYSACTVNGTSATTWAGGLVGINQGTIQNNSYATGAVTGKLRTGGLVGLNSGGSINNSYATGKVTGTQDYLGGLVGDNTGSIDSCYARGDVEGSTAMSVEIGGLVGTSTGSVDNSHAYGDVTGLGEVGGLIGRYMSAAGITDSSASGNVTGGSNVGGLIGNNGSNASITNCSASGITEGSGSKTGGLIGYNNGLISNCNAGGAVKGGTGGYTGGLVGHNVGTITGTVDNRVYATGNVAVTIASSYIGGLIGLNTGTISYAYATGAVTGNMATSVGGLIGENSGVLNNCHTTGAVTGDFNVGGLVGVNSANISNSHHYTGTVYGIDDSIGGLIGHNNYTLGTVNIGNCSVSSEVSGADNVGGLIGFIENAGAGAEIIEVMNCHTEGTYSITGNMNAGGLIGYSLNNSTGGGKITISGNYAGPGLTVVGDTNAGGLVGNNDESKIERCYSKAAVSGVNKIGGLIGNSATTFGVIESFATGTVTGTGLEIGGFVGSNSGDISNSYARGNVSGAPGAQYLGGFLGYNTVATITNCYSTGALTFTGVANYGGFAGMFSSGSPIDSFYDYEEATTAIGDGISITTSEMKDVATFTVTVGGLLTPWDFLGDPNEDTVSNDIWTIDSTMVINNGYPYLRLNLP